MERICFYHSPIGILTLAEEGGFLTRLIYQQAVVTPHIVEKTPLLRQAEGQLEAYFKGERKEFDLPLNPRGTEFQQRVWQALLQIPYGKTVTYGDITKQTANPKGCRAVGSANNKNPISIIIPCHRVIGTNGKLVGYGGGLNNKTFLLNLEAKNSQ